eukprot:1013434_1
MSTININNSAPRELLNLIIEGTLNLTSRREEMSKSCAFSELIERVPNTTMALDVFFKGKLSPVVKYLEAEDYTTMDDILCDDKKQFEDIVKIIEKGIDAENKEIEQYNENADALNNVIKGKNIEIQKMAKGIEEKIASIKDQINWLQEEITKEDDEERIKEIGARIASQEDVLWQEKQQQYDALAEIQEPRKLRQPIKPIRTKPKKGGPLFEKLQELCMRFVSYLRHFTLIHFVNTSHIRIITEMWRKAKEDGLESLVMTLTLMRSLFPSILRDTF